MEQLTVDSSWTLFLDRDGVINVRNFNGYITSVGDFEFLPNAVEGICKLSKVFGKVIVVTNQQGIGKGEMSECNLLEIHSYMLDIIHSKGGHIDFCFFAGNLRSASVDRRKPNPAMAIEAAEMFPDIDFSKSVMVGDTDSDLLFGENLGMKTVKVLSAEKTLKNANVNVSDLLDLYNKITI